MYYYTIFALSPKDITYPKNALEVNIETTGSIKDESQKNFEVLVQSIGLRAMPIIVKEPMKTINLAIIGSPTLAGEGYVFLFANEVPSCYEDYETKDPVGLLRKELHGIVLPNGVVIKTSGVGKNIEIIEGRYDAN